MKFSIKNFFSKCDEIHWKLRIWSHLLKKPLMENFIFCAASRRIKRDNWEVTEHKNEVNRRLRNVGSANVQEF